MVDTSEARRLMAKSIAAGAAGRRKIRRSVDLAQEAFHALPPGTVLRWNEGLPILIGMEVTRQADGSWDGATSEWVEEQWMRGNLVLPPLPAPEGPGQS